MWREHLLATTATALPIVEKEVDIQGDNFVALN
jgi:hypothetical protein